MILDGGPCSAGLESTIVAVRDDGWQVLRPGPVSSMEIEQMLGFPPLSLPISAIEAPGQMASHYAPSKPVRLNATVPEKGEYLIGFGAIMGDENLSSTGDLAQAAAHLFDALHNADASLANTIAVAPIPHEGIGIAMNDRLARAAVR
jgi:L-threonylcarbamoyladenylate synthase